MSTDSGNQFIVPPPGIAPTPGATQPVEPKLIDADDLITLPPGIVDSGTYRVAHERAPKPEERETDAPVFFPTGGIGLAPVPKPEEASVTPPHSAAIAEPAPQTIDDATRASVGRRSAPAWRLTLPDGAQVLVEKSTLVGRDPAQNGQWPDALLLPIIDSGKTVSKTHAALELTTSGQLIVHDLDSTNGVYVTAPGDTEAEVVPGTPALVEHGATVSFGEYTVVIERS